MLIFRHGKPLMVDYTPGSGDVEAGDVVLTGEALTCGVAHRPIANTTLGALAAGGGVYEGINLNNAADFEEVFWEGTAKKFTTAADGGNNVKFGYVVRDGGGGANTNCLVLHSPEVPA